MKLTKETLKQIIKEEVQAVLNEAEKIALDRTDKDAVRAAARMIKSEENLQTPTLKQLRAALAGGYKVVAILGGVDDGRNIDLMKYVTYTN